jgi:hypothetical protein
LSQQITGVYDQKAGEPDFVPEHGYAAILNHP